MNIEEKKTLKKAKKIENKIQKKTFKQEKANLSSQLKLGLDNLEYMYVKAVNVLKKRLKKFDKFSTTVKSFYNIPYLQEKNTVLDIHLPTNEKEQIIITRLINNKDIKSYLNTDLSLKKTSHPVVELKRAFKDREKKQLFPVVFYFHGGSWCSSSRHRYNFLAKEFAEEGFFCVNVDYRRMPQFHPHTSIDDALMSIKFILELRDYLPIDTENIFLAGDDAGAHIVSMISSKLKQNINFHFNIKAIALFYGIYEMKDFEKSNLRILKSIDSSLKTSYPIDYKNYVEAMSLSSHLTKDFPDTILFAGKKDKYYSFTENLKNKLDELNINNTLISFKRTRLNSNHFYLNYKKNNQPSKKSVNLMIEYFKLHTIKFE